MNLASASNEQSSHYNTLCIQAHAKKDLSKSVKKGKFSIGFLKTFFLFLLKT